MKIAKPLICSQVNALGRNELTGSNEFDATRIRKNGWRQGHVLSSTLAKELTENGIFQGLYTEEDLWIVISHDCDLNNLKFENEPLIELLQAKYLGNGKGDGNLAFGKNPRRYQFKIKERLYEIFIHSRKSIGREKLLSSCPDVGRKIEPDEVKKICLWVAKRYVRAAFPDSFNERLRPINKGLRTLLGEEGSRLTGIYITVDENELPPEQTYEIDIWATMKVQDYNDPQILMEGQSCFDQFIAQLGACDGIEINDDRLVPESRISLDELRLLKRWDYDELSLKENDWDTVVPIPS